MRISLFVSVGSPGTSTRTVSTYYPLVYTIAAFYARDPCVDKSYV